MRICLILAFCLSASFAHAETVRKQIGGMNATFSFSDTASAFPQLNEFLRIDAAETAEDYAAEAASRFRLTDEANIRGGRYVSVLRRTEAKIGGAGDNIYVTAMVWDGETKDFVRLDRFLAPGDARDEALIAIAHHLRETIKRQVWNGAPPPAFLPLIEQATSPDAAVLSNFTLSPNGGLVFHYSPYEVAPYEKGAIAIAAPVALYGQWLSPAGRAALR